MASLALEKCIRGYIVETDGRVTRTTPEPLLVSFGGSFMITATATPAPGLTWQDVFDILKGK